MVKIFVNSNNNSCRKSKLWFEDNDIEYEYIYIKNHKFTVDEIKNLLLKTENGFDSIISQRSLKFKENKNIIEDMSVSELIRFIINNPTMLKFPLMVSTKYVQSGYDLDKIAIFKKGRN